MSRSSSFLETSPKCQEGFSENVTETSFLRPHLHVMKGEKINSVGTFEPKNRGTQMVSMQIDQRPDIDRRKTTTETNTELYEISTQLPGSQG